MVLLSGIKWQVVQSQHYTAWQWQRGGKKTKTDATEEEVDIVREHLVQNEFFILCPNDKVVFCNRPKAPETDEALERCQDLYVNTIK